LIKDSRQVVDNLTFSDKSVYGINTGFGKFATTVIPNDKLEQLQINLIRSHASGIGDYLTLFQVRMLMALRINVLAKGYSGITADTLSSVIKAFNCSCLPLVPEQGTVGASGDLAPLSHIVLGLLGEGKMWSPTTGLDDAAKVLAKNNLEPLKLKPKEGLALINGTQMMAALGAEAIQRAKYLALQADIISSITCEVLKGNNSQFDDDIHAARPHKGQIEVILIFCQDLVLNKIIFQNSNSTKKVAARLQSLLHSDIYESKCYITNTPARKVQDPYTLRCIPQIHGIVNDTIKFCADIIRTEMNSGTDNPMVFVERQKLISGGNFHGEYPAKALDYVSFVFISLLLLLFYLNMNRLYFIDSWLLVFKI
jgi:histidine ammonia-lyase